MDFLSTEELESISLFSRKYFSDGCRRYFAIVFNYMVSDPVTNNFLSRYYRLPIKYDSLIHDGIVATVNEYIECDKHGKKFNKLYLIKMRETGFVIVLFPKKEYGDINVNLQSFISHNIGFELLLFFITANEDKTREDIQENILAGIEPHWYLGKY